MSLTALIQDRHGPVREFFEHRLPDLRVFRDMWRASGSVTILPHVHNPPWGYLGAAFDYRFRYFFDATDPWQFVAALADPLDPAREGELLPAHTSEDAFGKLASALLEMTTRVNLVGCVLDEEDERLLCKFCLVLAFYEAIARIDPTTANPLASLPYDADVDEQLALVDDGWVDDLIALTRGAFKTAGHLFTRPAVLNPSFAGSGDVGGADADLIIDGTLLEIKTTRHPPQRGYLYQLIGYMLLDYEDAYDIRNLGFYISRKPAIITWPVEELLDTLTGGSAPRLFDEVAQGPLNRDTLRAEFQAAIALAMQ